MKIYSIKFKTIVLFMGILVILSIILFSRGVESVEVSGGKELPIYSVGRDDNKISITFNAAWDDSDIDELIQILDKYYIKTSFFVVGTWVDKYPEALRKLDDAGHEILNHSDTHPHVAKLSKEKNIEEIRKCDEKIFNITGQRNGLYRAPYGEYNDTVLQAAREAGSFTIQWDVDSLDWKDPDPEQLAKNVTTKVKSGSIILMHSGAKNMPAALPMIIEELQGTYEFVKVSELIYRDHFKLDHAGRQIVQ